MIGDSLCCICLESNCNFLTDCCKNKIHKECIVNWIVYKGTFSCPLCRNETMRIPLNDLLTTPVLEYGLTRSQITTNMNSLLRSYNNLPYHIIINIPEEEARCCCLPRYSLFRYRFRYVTCGLTTRNIMYLLCIPLFYGILFLLIQNFYVVKHGQYVETD